MPKTKIGSSTATASTIGFRRGWARTRTVTHTTVVPGVTVTTTSTVTIAFTIGTVELSGTHQGWALGVTVTGNTVTLIIVNIHNHLG